MVTKPRRAAKPRETADDAARRAVLAHMEHVRSVGQALVTAAGTYLSAHKAAEADGRWDDEFSQNVEQASREFHRALANSSTRAYDIYFGRDDGEAESRRGAGWVGRCAVWRNRGPHEPALTRSRAVTN